MSPRTKRKTKKKLMESSPYVTCFVLFLVSIYTSSSSIRTEMLQQKVIKAFMERDDVSRVSPCMKTVILEKGENVPTRYRMLSI